MFAGAWRPLALLLLASEALYFVLARLDAVSGLLPVARFLAVLAALFALYVLAALQARRLRRTGGSPRGWILAGALLFRLTLIPAGLPPGWSMGEAWAGVLADVRGEQVSYERYLLYDDDVWRYLWDGHLAAQGLNPYVFAPADPHLDPLAETELWSDIRDNVNHPDIPTVYPPLAQGLSRLAHGLAPGSIVVWKLLVIGCDLLTVLFLLGALRRVGRPEEHVLLYAWNPLVVKVFAGSGHVDALAVAGLAAAGLLVVSGRPRWAALSVALAALAKLAPLVLLPLLLRRAGVAGVVLAGAVVLGAYAPYAWDGGWQIFAGLQRFSSTWEFNAGPYHLLRSTLSMFTEDPAPLARVVAALAVAVVVLLIAFRDDRRPESFPSLAAATLGAVIVLGPVVMPWYIPWLLPLAILGGRREWIVFSGLVCCAFLVMVDGTEHTFVLALEYGLFALALLWAGPLGGIGARRDWNSQEKRTDNQ